MRAQEIFERRTDSESIEIEDDVMVSIKNECSIAWDYYSHNRHIPLYRGVGGQVDSILYGDSSQGEPRKSRNTTNYYTLLMDHIVPEWQAYPMRSRSWICTNNTSQATYYGGLYMMFPVGDPVLGICPQRDIWFSFDEMSDTFGTLYAFNLLFEQTLPDLFNISTGETKEGIQYTLSELDKISKDEFEEALNDVFIDDDGVQDYRTDENSYEGIMSFVKDGMYNKFSEYVFDIFDPVKNGFRLMRFSEYLNNYGSMTNEREIWFSGPSYFVRPAPLLDYVRYRDYLASHT